MATIHSYKHVIITGGSSGIGKALAELLTRAGLNVTILARTQADLKRTQAELMEMRQSAQQIISALAVDVTNAVQLREKIIEACQIAGTVDLLITSAGVACADYFANIPQAMFEAVMAINYFGTLYAIQAVLPVMRSHNKGHIVMISSGAGLVGLFGYSAYSPTKFALRGLAESLRNELCTENINISVVYPPDTNTPQLAKENLTKPAETKKLTSSATLWEPMDVANVILKGVAKKRFAITPGVEISLLNRLQSLIAPVLHWYFDRLVKQVKQTLTKR